MDQADFWINKLNLQPHPEGGCYRQVYCSSESVPGEHLPARFGGARPFSTSIYFLLRGGQFSALHRIKSDEIWHFYAGAPLSISVLELGGATSELRLGPSPERGESFQQIVPAGAWFGAALEEPQSFALLGCTVAPGFDFADFELAERDRLVAEFPQHRSLIERLTRPQ